MAKVQALDTLWKKSGVDADDIVIAFNKHSLQDAEEFKQIMMKAQATVKSEMENAMQQMRMAQQAQMAGGMPGGPPHGAPGPPAGPPGGEADPADLGW